MVVTMGIRTTRRKGRTRGSGITLISIAALGDQVLWSTGGCGGVFSFLLPEYASDFESDTTGKSYLGVKGVFTSSTSPPIRVVGAAASMHVNYDKQCHHTMFSG